MKYTHPFAIVLEKNVLIIALLYGHVDGAGAESERGEGALAESGLAEQLKHGVALRHCGYAFGQIAVGAHVV